MVHSAIEIERAERSESLSLHSLLLRGSTTLGVAVALERSFSFLASLLAARIGGPQTFGAYAVVLATAGTIAAYAGAGIGTTANRFSGQYTREKPGYRGFLRALILITLLSATVGAVLMFAAAGPLARWMLRNDSLTKVLKIAALSSAMLVVLECCRGLLIGQHNFRALFVLSLLSGLGLLLVLPLAARISPAAMILGQGSVAFVTVLACVVFSRKLGLTPLPSEYRDESGPGLRPVFVFGLVQFSSVAGINIASWWIASLIARSDVLLIQMGLYAVGNQFRGLVSMVPGLFAQVGYSLLADESGEAYGGANRVMVTNAFATTSLTMMIGGFAIIFAPQLLFFAYGKSYVTGETVVVTLLATAIIHMSGMPAAHRLSVVALRSAGIINAFWAIIILLLGILLVPTHGANGAALAFIVAHAVANIMVLLCLASSNEMPHAYFPLFVAALFGGLALAGLGYLRGSNSSLAFIITVAMLTLWSSLMVTLVYIGRKLGYMPLWITKVLPSW